MSELALKEELRVLAQQAVPEVAISDFTLESFRYAVAEYDPNRDEIIISLPNFENARTGLGLLTIVRERYGDDSYVWRRLALQFVYGFLGNLSTPTFDPRVFETTWEAFWEELSKPEWTWLGLANLQNFRSQSLLLDLGDGITIRGRSTSELTQMGWTESHLERIEREWLEGAVNSSYVILINHTLAKTLDNFILSDTAGYGKAQRALQALRLLKDGDVAMGMMWFLRSTSFNLGLGGGVATGFPASRTFSPGNAYSLDEDELPAVRDLYEALRRYESTPDEEVPVNLNLALRSFSDIYERRNLYRTDTQLVGAITATEALLGTDAEVAFRLAFRVAMILGGDDDERVRIFERLRGYYDTRSSVVHGGSRLYNKSGQLKDKPRWHLDNQQDLRDFVRRLLIGFLRLTNSSGHSYDKEFFDNRLDNALLHGAQRSALRVAMGLEKNNTSS